ncbi:replication-relaxation family protein [Streptomyces sp. NRRL S-350]|uniref:replication-relaxation family protein n=1 Tax=Streptomyces sp. NRRL S-350 TaxID=1463902 RepID=UPI00099BB5BE
MTSRQFSALARHSSHLGHRRAAGNRGIARLRAFVEVDRGTMSAERLASKLNAYARYWATAPLPAGVRPGGQRRGGPARGAGAPLHRPGGGLRSGPSSGPCTPRCRSTATTSTPSAPRPSRSCPPPCSPAGWRCRRLEVPSAAPALPVPASPGPSYGPARGR